MSAKRSMTHGMKQTPKFANDMTLGRLFGLGKSPQGLGSQQIDALVSQSLTCGFTQVPVVEYVTMTFELPVTDDVIDITLGDEIDVSTISKQAVGPVSIDSSYAINGLLQVDMVAIGIGLHVFAEPESGTILGNLYSTAPAPGGSFVSPDSFTLNDIANGALGSAIEETTTTITPALLEWGAPAWNAMWHLLNGYQFNWITHQRYAILQELACDVAFFGPYAEALAAGTSQEAAQRLIRRANDQYQGNLGFPGVFEGINAQRVGSVSTAPLAPAGANVGIFHPTRAYDEVSVTWGGVRGQGTTGMQSAYRRLPKPVFLEKGIPINMKLIAQDAFHQREFQRYMSATDSQGGSVANVVSFAGGSGGATGTGAAVNLELTLDATPVTVPQQVNTDRSLWKGGAFKIAALIKGFEVWGPWRAYMGSLIQSGAMAMPNGAGSSSNMMQG